MLQHFEGCDSVERAVGEGQPRDVSARRPEARHAAASNGAELAGAARIAVDGDHRQRCQRRIGEQRPEEGPAPGSDVQVMVPPGTVTGSALFRD